ncbi:MAG: type IV pilin N-terminal domain-containing protein [Methanospirillum sp.]|uniref:type IV pilin N-terminal domain-containing protein n=1 Tax=Methanospirillum sp. TaxID=45200 RepID=UPI002371F186|nr:type IV pilin N-terminal domain-containing protein [Methanospirillum sp.]MDD1727592.1 type IV pilin N-terminal domain-containing protein [Methanospirillum sp.]
MGKRDSGVSSVIGEMLMIVLVLILVPVVTISLMNQLPEDRTPTVTIKMGPINNTGYVAFYHKGGDWIRKENIQVFRNGYKIDSTRLLLQNLTFDLGDELGVSELTRGDNISIIAKNAVIFSGVVN